MGSTLTSLAYEKFSKADKAALKQNDLPAPAAQLDIGVSLSGFKEGDSNYPINPTLKLTNKSTQTIPGGTRIEFLVPTSTSDTITDQSGMGLKVVESGGNQNSDGIANEKDFHKVALTLPAWKAWTPGTDVEVAMTYPAGRRRAEWHAPDCRQPDHRSEVRLPGPGRGGAGQQWWW